MKFLEDNAAFYTLIRFLLGMTAFGACDIAASYSNAFGCSIDKFYFFEFICIEPDAFTLRAHVDDHHGVRIAERIKRFATPGAMKRLFAGMRGYVH